MGKPSEGDIRIFIADSSPMECALLTSLLSRSHYRFRIVGSAAKSGDVLSGVREQQPDLVVLSSTLQDGPLVGFKVLRDIRACYPNMRMVMLLNSSERDLVIDAFRTGASGVFSRLEPVDRLCKCLDRVYKGQIWANSSELQFILEALAQASPLRIVNAGGMNLLTPREGQVVRLVAEGLTNREISRKLSLSEHTVKNYLFRVYDKLGISTRVELTLHALSRAEPVVESQPVRFGK